jgi:hypothetical protein
MKKRLHILGILFLLPLTLWSDQEVKEQIVSITETEAVLSFLLPQKATVQFFYAETFSGINNGQSYLGVDPSDRIEVPLSGLKPGTVYYFHANFYDEKNQRVYYRISWFKTPGVPDLKILSFSVSEGMRDAEITLLVNKPGKGVLRINGLSDTFPFSALGKRKVQLDLSATVDADAYSVRVPGLIPDTSYSGLVSFSDGSDKTVSQKIGFTTKENNIAYGKKVKGTFNSRFIADVFELEGDVLSRVTDGNFDYRTGMSVSEKDPLEEEQWVIVDLEQNYPIKDVQTYWRALAYPLTYEVSLSQDGRTWEANTKVKNDGSSTVVGVIPMKISQANFNGRKARFVKVSMPKGTQSFQRFNNYKFVQLVELKVHPKE